MIKNKILEVLKSHKPMTKEQILKQFEVSKIEKASFFKMLDELEKEEEIFFNKDSEKYYVIDGEIYTSGKIQGNERGFGFLLQEEADVFITKDRMNGALHGDRVIAKILEESKGNSKEGEIISIIERRDDSLVGTFQNQKSFGFVVPDESKISYDIFIPKKFMSGAKNGQKVLVKIDKWPKNDKKPEGKIVEVLGYPGDKGVDILSVAATYNLPMNFNKEVIEKAKSIPQEVDKSMIKGRVDLRNLTTFTIDGPDSKDFDDAVSMEILENGNYYLGVHIADVAHYVKQRDELDKEAYKRGNSVYLVDKVIPMLPKELSNGICSLNEGVDRLTLSVMMEINKKGKVLRHNIVESVINSDRRLIYDNVSDFIEKNEIHSSVKGLEKELTAMNEVAKLLAEKEKIEDQLTLIFQKQK